MATKKAGKLCYRKYWPENIPHLSKKVSFKITYPSTNGKRSGNILSEDYLASVKLLSDAQKEVATGLNQRTSDE